MNRTAALFAASALIFAACGGTDEADPGVASLSNGTSTTAPADGAGTDEVDQEQAAIALTECLREQGLDIDDPTVDADGNVQLGRPNNISEGDGVRREFRTGFEACQDLAEGLGLGFGRADRTEIEDTLFEFAACMRDNGYDMPDPDFSNFGPGNENEGESGGPGQGGGPLGDIDQDDPDFEAAQEVCGELLAGFGPGGGRGLGGGPGAGGGEGG
jgi:hypothetical protein